MDGPPEVPDLKKALENKPKGFAWTPGGTVAKAAASAAGVSSREPTALERLKTGQGKLLLAAAILVIGGLAFSLVSFGVAGSAGGGANLGGVASSMKIRFARPNDPTGLIAREKAAGNERMRFDLIAGAADKAPGGKPGDKEGAPGAPGENGEGGAPMNYDEGSAAGKAGTAGRAGAAAAGKGGDQGGSGGLAGGGGGGAKLGGSFGSIKFQGMRRVSANSGFRSIQGRRGAGQTLRTQGSSANASTAERADGFAGGAVAGGGSGAGAAGVRSGRKTDGGSEAAGGAAGGSGGGGGASDLDASGVEATQDTPGKVADLMSQAKSDRDRAEKEKEKAIALKAAGQDPQSLYHYERYKKAKESADQKEGEANQLLSNMNNAAQGLNAQPQKGK